MTCNDCECADDRACPGGCFWVYRHLCSACVFQRILEAARGLAVEQRASVAAQLILLAEKLETHADDAPGVPDWEERVGLYLDAHARRAEGGRVAKGGKKERKRL